MRSSSILQKGLIIVLVPFVLNLVWIGLFWHSLQQSSALIDTVRKDGDVLLLLSRSIASVNKLIIAVIGYVQSGGKAAIKKQAEDEGQFLLDTLNELSNATKSDTGISALVGSLCRTVNVVNSDVRAVVDADPLHVDFGKVVTKETAQSALRDTTAMMIVMRNRDAKFRRTLDMEEEERGRTRVIAGVGLALNLALAVLLAIFLQHTITDRIAVLVRKTHNLTEDAYETEKVTGVDELVKLDQEIMSVHQQLQAAYQFRRSFMSMMAKSIQGPLRDCVEAAENLERDEPVFRDEALLKRLRGMHSSASACVCLIDDMLLLQSLASGTVKLNLQDADMKDVASAAVELVSGLAFGKNISILNEVESVAATMDPARMQQVLVNLIANAIKFSPANAKITIESRCTDANLRISVKDQGPGIDEQTASSLFKKFVQGEAGKASGGSGLGLSICKLIVDAHGGIIGVESTPGQGSTFWFEIETEVKG